MDGSMLHTFSKSLGWTSPRGHVFSNEMFRRETMRRCREDTGSTKVSERLGL